MSYCRNCGAKLEDQARFCRVCGTPVAPKPFAETKTMPGPTQQYPPKLGFPVWAIILIVAISVALVTIVIVFLPIQQVNFEQSNQVSDAHIDAFSLNFEAEIANLTLTVRDLPGNQRAALNVSATGWRGIFGTGNPVALHFDEDRTDRTLVWTVNVSRSGNWPVYNRLDINCDVYIDPEAELNISVILGTGAVTFDSGTKSNFQDLRLQTTTGGITALFKEGSNISGEIQIEATTGAIKLDWIDANVSGNTPLDLKTTTGSVELSITQTRQTAGNVTLNAEATTGAIALALDVKNDIGAKITAETAIGGINVNQHGFSGDNLPIQSKNYPASSNFQIAIGTTVGGIDINANYGLTGTPS